MIAACPLFQAQAQLEVRLSVKVILDANGMRPAGGRLSTDAGIRIVVDNANRLLATFGRGYQYRVTEILDLPGHTELLDLACHDASDAIDAGVAFAGPASYLWRTSAANVYVNQGADSDASCAFNSMLVMGYDADYKTLLHEEGHYMGLAHTHGGGCHTCEECPNIVSDDIDDTLPDRSCWGEYNISTNAFQKPFAELTAVQQMMVSNTFNNIMAYHRDESGSQTVFTSDQWDRMADFSRTDRAKVMNGRTVFVDPANTVCVPLGFSKCNGNSTGPFPTVSSGVAFGSPGDIILIRPGHYNEPMTITKAVALRATRGDALIGKP
jgi:hypothetical protein